MATMFGTVGLVAKHGDERVIGTLERLIEFLRARPVEIEFDAESARALPTFGLPVTDRSELGRRCDLVIVVGGDGTFLSAARSLVEHGVPLLGVNLGRLGFLADIMPGDMTDRLVAIFDGQYDEEDRSLLETGVSRDGRQVVSLDALNDVVAHKWDIARLLTFETYIDGRLVSRQRSDGLIVATPTGSTAHALSGGGPILHPGLDAIVLVPICPQTLSSRPLVVHGRSAIEIRMDPGEHPTAHLTCDGQSSFELAPGDRITIRKKDVALKMIHPRGHDHYAILRAKLHWAQSI